MISINIISRLLAICILGVIIFFAGRYFWQQSQNAQFTEQAVNLSANDAILGLQEQAQNNEATTSNYEVDELSQRVIDEQLLGDNLLNELKDKIFTQSLVNDFAINLSAYRAALENTLPFDLPNENNEVQENSKEGLNTESSLNLPPSPVPVPENNTVQPNNDNQVSQNPPPNYNQNNSHDDHYQRAIPPGDTSHTIKRRPPTQLDRHIARVNNYYNNHPTQIHCICNCPNPSTASSVEIWNGITPENQNYNPEDIGPNHGQAERGNINDYNTHGILRSENQDNQAYSQVTEGGSSPAAYTIATVQGPIKDIVYELNSVAVSPDGSEAKVFWKVKNNSPHAIQLNGALRAAMSAERTKIIDFFTQKSFPVKWNRQIPAANCLMANQIPAYGRIDCSALVGPVLERNSVIESDVLLVKLPGAKNLARINLNV
jgi:hypothetical protein